MATPTLTIVKTVPDAVKRAPVLILHKVLWMLRADYPAPHGTVYLRYSVHQNQPAEDSLDIFTPTGKLIQRLMDTPISLKSKLLRLQATWLVPGKKAGPLIQWEQIYPDEKEPRRFFLAFPDGFAGLCTLSQGYDLKKKYAWNGIRFVEAGDKNGLDIDTIATPRWLPAPKQGVQTRFAAAMYGGRRYLLRWGQAGMRYWLEVMDSRGQRVALHWLRDDFSGTAHSSLGALWLDEKRQSNPILEARDSDQVRLYVFTDGFTKLICAQDFNDSSSSISATTVSFDRDERGLLTVTESYSERPDEEGHGGNSSETTYIWSGKGFDTKK